MDAACRQETIDLHQFFQQWFTAILPPTGASFARFSRATDAGFYLVSPDGRLHARQQLLSGLRGAHGQWRESGGSIRIANFTIRWQRPPFLLATYEEWQTVGHRRTARLSSVLFRREETAPHGVAWLAVHETWLQPPPR